jgi:transglutaminase/protease-like cytokinesis protein 3
VEISTTDVDEMEHAYQAIRYDYANLFWVDQFSYVTYRIEDEITSIEITPTYTMTLEEQQSIQQQIDAEVDRMLANAPVDGSDYDKALYVYETLISEVDYVAGSENNQNIISVFINHETVCQGYAYATQYLLEKLGITSATVVGQARGQSHAWNLVMLDGDYYYIDTTWGNSQYFTQDDQSEMVKNKYVDYDYFCATTETLLLTHQIDDQIPMPECTATADNYYIHEGRYISTWDPDQIGEMIASAYYGGESQIEIKFATVELYEQAMQYFVEDYHVTDYCGEMDVIRYIEKGENSILFLQF